MATAARCAALENDQVSYVLAVAVSHRITTAPGTCRADEMARRVPRAGWQRLSAGAGAKGHRWYDWALVGICPGTPGRH